MNYFKNIAAQIAWEYLMQGQDDSGMYPESFRAFVSRKGLCIEEDDRGNSESSSPSWDASIIAKFDDNSQLSVGNPSQGAFSTIIRELESPNDYCPVGKDGNTNGGWAGMCYGCTWNVQHECSYFNL